MNTFSKCGGSKTPQEAKEKIAQQVAETGITEPKNLEEQGLSLVGKDVFEKLVKGYTENSGEESVRNFRHLLFAVCRCVLPMTTIILMTVFREFPLADTQESWKRCWMGSR